MIENTRLNKTGMGLILILDLHKSPKFSDPWVPRLQVEDNSTHFTVSINSSYDNFYYQRDWTRDRYVE